MSKTEVFLAFFFLIPRPTFCLSASSTFHFHFDLFFFLLLTVEELFVRPDDPSPSSLDVTSGLWIELTFAHLNIVFSVSPTSKILYFQREMTLQRAKKGSRIGLS